MEYRSPALDLPGACPAPERSPDSGVPWHYGDPHAEQRRLVAGVGAVDLSHRGVITVTGPDRLAWLHSLTTQHLDSLAPGSSTMALILSPHGHVEHVMHMTAPRRGSPSSLVMPQLLWPTSIPCASC
jgi:hypothetical protein